MQPSIDHGRRSTIPLLLALALAAGCGDSTSPDPRVRLTKPADSATPDVGSIRVSIATTGADLDPDGYTLTVDNTSRSVGINDTIDVAIPSKPPSGHTLRLDGVAVNCVDSFSGLEAFIPELKPVTITVSCFRRSIPPAFATTQLVFVRGNGYQRDNNQIYRMRGDGTGLVALGTGWRPIWSPDGQRIAFRGNDGGLYVMAADGANTRLVTKSAEPTAWLPDGSRLAFTDDNGWITIVSVDGSTAPVSVTRPGGDWAWSPDGSRIAVERMDGTEWDPGPVEATVSVMDPDGSNPKILARFPVTDFTGGGLAWSPDGKRLAIGGGRLLLVNADGSGLTEIGSVVAHDPVWSPDGQAIAFDTGCGNAHCSPSVFYVTADGSTAGLLIVNAWFPSWHK